MSRDDNVGSTRDEHETVALPEEIVSGRVGRSTHGSSSVLTELLDIQSLLLHLRGY